MQIVNSSDISFNSPGQDAITQIPVTKGCSKQLTVNSTKINKEKYFFEPNVCVIVVARSLYLFGLSRGDVIRRSAQLAGCLKAVNTVPISQQ